MGQNVDFFCVELAFAHFGHLLWLPSYHNYSFILEWSNTVYIKLHIKNLNYMLFKNFFFIVIDNIRLIKEQFIIGWCQIDVPRTEQTRDGNKRVKMVSVDVPKIITYNI